MQHFQVSKCLGVTLDHTRSFEEHCISTKAKVNERNVLRKLTNKSWGADPQILGISALAFGIRRASKHAKSSTQPSMKSYA